LMERTEKSGVPGSPGEPGESFCPECGQSLDLSRHMAVPTGQRTLGSYVFATFGLVFVVVFGINGWYAHRAIVAIDQQIVDSRTSRVQDVYGSPSDQERVAAGTVISYLTERLPIQQRFDQNVAGLALGILATTVGVGTQIRQRRERSGSTYHSLLGKVTLKLWDLGNSVMRPFLWTVLMLGASLTVSHVIQGEPLTLDLMNRALERTVAIVVTVTNALL